MTHGTFYKWDQLKKLYLAVLKIKYNFFIYRSLCTKIVMETKFFGGIILTNFFAIDILTCPSDVKIALQQKKRISISTSATMSLLWDRIFSVDLNFSQICTFHHSDFSITELVFTFQFGTIHEKLTQPS